MPNFSILSRDFSKFLKTLPRKDTFSLKKECPPLTKLPNSFILIFQEVDTPNTNNRKVPISDKPPQFSHIFKLVDTLLKNKVSIPNKTASINHLPPLIHFHRPLAKNVSEQLLPATTEALTASSSSTIVRIRNHSTT